MADTIASRYRALSPKGKQILQVVSMSGNVMTRNDISDALGQFQLSGNDLRLLKIMNRYGFVDVRRWRLHDLKMQRDDTYRFMIENYDFSKQELRWGVSGFVYVYRINSRMRDVVKLLLDS